MKTNASDTPTKRLKATQAAIDVEGVSKSFGRIRALDNVSLQAQRCRVTGLLGPNGAGKSTLIKIMTTLLLPDSGRLAVDGVDVLRESAEARKHIGLAGQFSAIDDFLTGRETLEMVGRLYSMTPAAVRERTRELLAEFDLVEVADRQAKTYSGGLRRRLDLAASLVASPPVIFLDEPTTGLDPRTRLQLRGIVRDLAAAGATILLTTQYLEEADALCDYIYLIDRGRMAVEGTADRLKSDLGQNVIELKVKEGLLDKTRDLLEGALKRKVEVEDSVRQLRLRTENGADDIVLVAAALKKAGIRPEELSLHKPSLDDVFLAVTGPGSAGGGK